MSHPSHVSIEITKAETLDEKEMMAATTGDSRDTLRSPDEFYSGNSNTLRNTLKRNERSWVDPYEPNAQGTFYHKQFETFRPKFDTIQSSMNVDDLFDDTEPDTNTIHDEDSEDPELVQEKAEPEKFGTWDGVFARCLLNIFGVIMFLRLGWVVGQAGVLQAILIILLSAIVTAFTTASMSALCTNGQVKGGGAYYLTSRSLGPAIGGSVGVLFSMGNAVAVSLYLIGFAETLVTDLGPIMTGDKIWDIRIWSNIVLVIQLLVSLRGLGWVVKIQMVLLVFISISILLFFVGSFYRTSPDIVGIGGWTNGNLASNWGSQYTPLNGVNYNFFGVFGVFFPAVTGIMAGANISGDLRNPSYDIPVGTFWSVAVSTFVYALMAIFLGAVANRSGLLNNFLIAADICVNRWIIVIGVYAATLSSAIASLVGAPRILQAVAEDDLIPILKTFADTNAAGDPVKGYFVSFAIAFGCNLIGDLNLVAPLITDFFMIAYLMINFSCFALELAHSPGWRPSFRYFNAYTAISGAILCLAIMFLIDWRYALAAVVLGMGLWFYVLYRDPAVNWGTAQDAQNYYRVHKTLLRMRKQKGHVKNWRPGFLILTGVPDSRPHLVLFGQTLRKAYGPLFYGAIKTGDYRTNIAKFQESHHAGYLPDSKIIKNAKGFYESVIADNFRQGSQMLLQLGGLGALKPNILIVGYKRRWLKETDDEIAEYVDIIRDALAMSMGVIICCKFRSINWLVDRFVPTVMSYSRDYQDVAIEEDDEFEYSEEWAAGQGENPIVDVWWLIDDGGLLLIMPYVMQLHSFWSNCRFRLNLLVDSERPNTDVVVISGLIKKFRLPLEGPRLIETGSSSPQQRTIDKFEKLSGAPITDEPRPGVTRRWLRVSELLVEHSRHSGLVLLTLPIPSKRESPRSFMAMMECLADRARMPPTLIMRGNGESTLTFYSE